MKAMALKNLSLFVNYFLQFFGPGNEYNTIFAEEYCMDVTIII